MKESSSPRIAAELARVVGTDFQMMWQESEVEERTQIGGFQVTTEKGRKKPDEACKQRLFLGGG